MNELSITISQSGLNFLLDLEMQTASVIGKTDDNEDSEITIPISIKYEFDDFVIKSVNKGSFQGTTTVKSILFPTDSQVSVIEEDAFADSLIEHLVIPTSVTDLQDGWCRCTPKLFKIMIMPKNERYIYLDNEIILGKPHLTCDEYKDLVFVRRDAKYVKIPSFISQISSYAFSDSKIEQIYIASDISQISKGAFYYQLCCILVKIGVMKQF